MTVGELLDAWVAHRKLHRPGEGASRSGILRSLLLRATPPAEATPAARRVREAYDKAVKR
jgi:hypothetical protein